MRRADLSNPFEHNSLQNSLVEREKGSQVSGLARSHALQCRLVRRVDKDLVCEAN